MEQPFMPLVILFMLLSSAAGDGGADGLINVSRLEMFVDDLPEMPRLRGFSLLDGAAAAPVSANLTIGMYQIKWKFHRDLPETTVFAYGATKATATIPGPTIEARSGIPTHVTWQNHLPSRHILPWDPTIPTPRSYSGVPTVVHLHGGITPPSSDGHSHSWFTNSFASTGPTFTRTSYFYPNFQPPGNLWYHDHAIGLTRVNLLAGLIGSYVIRDPSVESNLGLPSTPFDLNLVIFDRSFSTDGSIYMNATGDNPRIHPQWQPEYFGDVIVVNGKAWPRIRVQRRKYRFRILNASNARFFRLFFHNGIRFHHVGSDSVYLPKPVSSHRFLLAPSEIADVVVDFATSTTDEAILCNDAPYPYPTGDPTDEINGMVMKFLIERPSDSERPTRLPARLLRYAAPAEERSAMTRYIAMYEYESQSGEPTHLFINGKSYDAPATERPKEGTAEIWNVINLTDDNHPLHVHLGVFAVREQRELADVEEFKRCMMRSNDAERCHVEDHAKGGRRYPVPRWETGWKNVFKMRPGCMTRILVWFKPLLPGSNRFPFNTTEEPGYVYHCHILDHEDNMMMRPLKLIS